MFIIDMSIILKVFKILSAVDSGLDPRSALTKNHKRGICCSKLSIGSKLG